MICSVARCCEEGEGQNEHEHPKDPHDHLGHAVPMNDVGGEMMG